jgi:CubicO group peptidase (beta-lactamase class C family)
MESGINARAIDFAKLGRLYLDGGTWNGQQIVPAGWVVTSTQTVATKPAGYYPSPLQKPYGTISHEMFWWRIARPNGEVAFSAFGNHGQYIFVSPAERLIIVRVGKGYGIPAFDWFEVFTTMADQLPTSRK